MPATLTCDLCHQENAVLIVGYVETGVQDTVGMNCLPAWALSRAEAAIGFDAIAEMVAARIAAMAPPPEEEPAQRRRGKRPQEAREEQRVQAPDLIEDPSYPAAPSDG